MDTYQTAKWPLTKDLLRKEFCRLLPLGSMENCVAVYKGDNPSLAAAVEQAWADGEQARQAGAISFNDYCKLYVVPLVDSVSII